MISNSSHAPRKSRKRLYNLPLHKRRKLVSASLDKKLRQEYKKRSAVIRKGDKVKIVKGDHRKKEGKVTRVDLRAYKIFIEGIIVKKKNGKEAMLPISPSNVVIMELDLADPKRKEVLARGVKG